MKGISNTQRTLRYIREQGWFADIVEKFNPYAGKFGQRKDLFGIIDIIALGENSIIGIQSAGKDFKEHDEKILNEPMTEEWLKSGGRLMLIAWRKIKLFRGSKATRWMPKIKEYKIEKLLKQKGRGK